MGLSLRIDVDNPFGYATLFKKILNRVSLDYNLVPRWSSLGYLDNAKKLRDYLEANSVPATWYFRNITTPNKRNLDKFSRSPFDIALHAERTDTLQHFSEEVEQWKKGFGRRPRGFTKHGSGDLKLSRKHVMEYDNDTFIEFGAKLGFEYFSGNGIDFAQQFELRRGLVFMPSVLWLDNIGLYPSNTLLKDALDYSRDNPLIILVHPIRWAMQLETREKLDHLIQQTDFETIGAQINAFKERINTT